MKAVERTSYRGTSLIEKRKKSGCLTCRMFEEGD